MRRMLLIILLNICYTINAFSQAFTLGELTNMAAYSTAKFDNYICRRGYKPMEKNTDFVKYVFSNKKQKDSTARCITKYTSNSSNLLSIDKLKEEEYKGLMEKIKAAGFIAGVIRDNMDTQIFQKDDITLYTIAEKDTVTAGSYYTLIVEKRNLPKAKDIVYVEDLLALHSHEDIASIFGRQNVVKDEFVYPDGRIKKCSVLFPNTKDEAIFLWKDEANYRNVAAIRAGGYARTKGAMQYISSIEQNTWASKQGIYTGMSLKELDEKNGNEIDFYGWDWNSGGTLASNNNGKIDFTTLSLVLSCLNCNDAKYRGNKINKSTVALEEDRKINVVTIIVMPEKMESTWQK